MDNKHFSYEFEEILNSQIQIFSSFYKVWGTKTAIMQKKPQKNPLTISFPQPSNKHETYGPNSQQ